MNTRISWMALLLMLAISVPSAAQERDGKQTVSEATYNALADARKLTAKGEHGKAIEKMNGLLRDVKGKAYEEALAWQMLGYAYAGSNDYKSAASAFRQALRANALPSAETRELTYNLAQILINDEQYKEGLTYLEDWLKGQGSPPFEARMLAAVGYYRSGNCNAAIPYLRTLAAEAKEDREKWSQALLGCYVEAKQYDEAAEVLEQAVRANPENNENWMQLAAAYQQGEHKDKAIAVLELMQQRGALNGEQMVNLARMYLANDVPYKAADMLERQMQAGTLLRNRDHLLLLADSLLLAQERERAAEVLNELIRLAADGELYHRLGRIYFDLQQWPQAMAALQSAIATEGLRDTATANLLLGIAAVHANQQALAERSLALAADSMGTRAQALWWLQRLQREHPAPDAESGPEG